MNHRRSLLCATTAVGLSAALLSRAQLPPRAQDLAGSGSVMLTLTEGTNMMAVASPDRQLIAMDLLGALWILPFGGGEAQRITPDSIEARHPSWAPNSRSLTFQGFDSAWHIFTIDSDGTDLKILTNTPFDDQEPEWSPDGSRIAFLSDRYGGMLSVWDIGANGEGLRQRTIYNAQQPCWSPGGFDLYFFGFDPAMNVRQLRPPPPRWWVVDSAGGHRPLFPPANAPPRTQEPIACANGRAITSVAFSRNIGEELFPFGHQWISPSEVLYTADGHIKRRTLLGAPSTIAFTARITIPRWPGRKAGRELQSSLDQPVLGIGSPSVAPNGTIAFTALGDLWLVPPDKDPAPFTNDTFVELDPAWSSDGTRLAFASDRGGSMNLWMHNFLTGVDTQLSDERDPVSGPSWSPDDRFIAYLTGRRTLMVVDATGIGRPRMLGQSRAGLGRPSWKPFGQVVSAGRLLPYSIYDPTGTNQWGHYPIGMPTDSTSVITLHRSAGNRLNNGPVWAPRELRVAYVGEGRLWTLAMTSDGQPADAPVEVAAGMPSQPRWETDGRHLVYVTPDGLRRAEATGNSTEPIAVDLAWRPLQPSPRVVVHAGALFDGKTERLLSLMDMTVEDGRILDIAPHDDTLHRGRVIDATDLTVMPGLIESATRLDATYGEPLGRIFLAYGITSVKDFSSDSYAALEIRESFDAGRRLGPRVFLSGDALDGLRVFDAGGTSITSPEDLDALSRQVDFLSTHARFPDTLLKAIANHDRRPAIASPMLLPAARFGLDNIVGFNERGRQLGSDRITANGTSYRDVVDIISRSGIPFTPELCAAGLFGLETLRSAPLLNDPRLSLSPQGVLEEVRATRDARRRQLGPSLVTEASRLTAMSRTVVAVATQGGTIVAGTGSDGRSIPYGLSLHVELEEYVRAGMTPFQALQTATVNAAAALGVEDQIGSIERGKVADLIFVTGDPLTSVVAAQRVQGVMRGGWYFDRTGLGVP